MAANIAHIPGGILPYQPSTYEGGSRGRAASADVIDVQVRRVSVEEPSVGKAQAESAVAEPPLDAKARRLAEIESELLKQPFLYERVFPGGDVQLKLPPLRRGILIDIQA